jgi:hypothetical protein
VTERQQDSFGDTNRTRRAHALTRQFPGRSTAAFDRIVDPTITDSFGERSGAPA